MRWSLILSTITVLFTLSVALVIPPSESLNDLERRAISSKRYRQNAAVHDYAYKFDPHTGDVTRKKLKLKDRLSHGSRLLAIHKTDADHLFEKQMLRDHLKIHHGIDYNELAKKNPKLKHEVEHIMNRPENVALVPARVNRGKGQVTKHGMPVNGKAIKPNKTRDQYMKISYPSARKTAKDLDKVFKNHGHDFKDKTFHNTLRTTMNKAKIMKPGDPSPRGSSKGSSRRGSVSSKASSHHGSVSSKASSHHGSAAKARPRGPIVVGSTKRRSARIAAAKAAKRIAAAKAAKRIAAAKRTKTKK